MQCVFLRMLTKIVFGSFLFKGKNSDIVLADNQVSVFGGIQYVSSILIFIFHGVECTFHGLEYTFHGVEYTFQPVERKIRATERRKPFGFGNKSIQLIVFVLTHWHIPA